MPLIKCHFTPIERRSILELRYHAYIGEKGYCLSNACHQKQTLVSDLDTSGELVAGFVNGHAVGTLLCNDSKTSNLSDYAGLYGVEQIIDPEQEAFSVTTLFVVSQAFRSTYLPFLLGVAAYRKLLSKGIKYNFIDCETNLIDFYLRVGYEVCQSNFEHPEYGPGVVMKLELDNEARLRRLRSPLLRYLLQYREQLPAQQEFQSLAT